MAFKDVLGHSMAIHRLQNAIKTDKVVQSYLFVGNEGIGKKWAAVQFSKALNCLNNPVESGDACDQCLSCRKIDEGLHPDLLLLEPENQVLKVDQVRQMQRVLAFKPYEGRRRVCIIAAADRMAPHMSNILLKTLEEPPLHTVIVLLARHPRMMLPTILSRCQMIRFHPLPVPLVSQWLSQQRGLDEKEAHLLAGLSEGSPGKALELREQIQQIPRENLLRDFLGPTKLSLQEMEGWVEAMPAERTDLVAGPRGCQDPAAGSRYREDAQGQFEADPRRPAGGPDGHCLEAPDFHFIEAGQGGSSDAHEHQPHPRKRKCKIVPGSHDALLG